MPEQGTTTNQIETEDSAQQKDLAQVAAERQKRRKLRFEQRTLLSDCSLMLRYALDESCQIPQSVVQDIAKADALLIAAGKDPLSDTSPDVLKLQVITVSSPDAIDDILLRIHNALSNLVSPATALSLRETDPDVVWFGMPRIVQSAIVGAALFLIWFLFAVPKPQLPKPTSTQSTATPIPNPNQGAR
jgi:hypothetical protein